MELNSRETWTILHDLILGTVFLLAFAGALLTFPPIFEAFE